MDDTDTIHIEGVFSVYARRLFESTYTLLLNNSENKNIVVNLAAVDCIDSSALGMLIELREHALAKNQRVHLSNPNARVRQVLDIACFHKLFFITNDHCTAKVEIAAIAQVSHEAYSASALA